MAIHRLAALVAGLALLAACSSDPEPERPAFQFNDDADVADATPPATSQEVTYLVEGSAREGFMTFQTPSGQRQEKVSLPLINRSGSHGFVYYDFTPGDFLYVSVQNQDDYGRVVCEIEVDGVTVSSNSSSAPYGIATCQG